MKHAKDVVKRTVDNTATTKEVSSGLVASTNIFSPKNIIIDMVQYLLVWDVNGLFWTAVNVKTDKRVATPNTSSAMLEQICVFETKLS
jgi:hypothetical protein